jgi:CRP/FNR family cyclic AMP-dependent transcriptional regulator
MPTRAPRIGRSHWHLRGIDWLRRLPRSHAEAIRRASKTRECRAAEQLFGPIAVRPHVYLLEQGLVRIYRVSVDGREYTVGYVRPGELFGEVSVLSGQPSESFAQTVTPSRVLQIPRETFLRVLRSDNSVLYEVTKKTARRLVRCQSRAEDLVFCDTRTRLARLLLRLGEDFGQLSDGGLVVGFALSEQEMGTLIGATRQTVSDALGGLIRDGLVVRHNRRLRLADTQALRKFAGISRRSRAPA